MIDNIYEVIHNISYIIHYISLKRNIKPIQDAKELIDKYDPVYWNWKNTNKKSCGLIAQDVKSIDNNLFCHILNYDEERIVSEDDLPAGETEDYHNQKAHLKNQQKIKDVMSIKQNQLMGIMINVIQQNQKKIEKLERKISVLESK